MVNQGAVKDHLASRRLQVTLRVSMNINFSTSEAHFVSQISQPPERTQNWFCIQNLPMDLSFLEKETAYKSVTWFTSYGNSRDTGDFRSFFLNALYHEE